jgi:hypothetical protein
MKSSDTLKEQYQAHKPSYALNKVLYVTIRRKLAMASLLGMGGVYAYNLVCVRQKSYGNAKFI